MKEFDKLELSTETIRELSAEEMGQVVGGATTQGLTGYYPSINAPCISVRICVGG